MSKTILVVEDEKNIVDILSFNLQREGYAVLEAGDGEKGLALALKEKPDLVLLDLMLPKMNGFDVCRHIRAEDPFIPILMLTAREDESDKILGLEVGADDYITKPFSMKELLARVRANIRRTELVTQNPKPSAADEAGTIERDVIKIDTRLLMAYKNDSPLDLTQREFELLRFFVTSPGRVFSRESLMEHVWNYEGFVGDVRAVDVAVRRLREKVEDDPANPTLILTRRGQGYYFK